MTDVADLWQSTPIRHCSLPDVEGLNRRILAAFEAMGPEDFDHRSHLIGGRYENLYLDRARMPALEPILEHALVCAGRILGYPPDHLRCGFWFNAMDPGQWTSEHTHEENDELLSAVYYVEAPEGSGDLILYDGPLTVHVAPEAGVMLFFPPGLPHSVEINQSGRTRLSIGFNFGPVLQG